MLFDLKNRFTAKRSVETTGDDPEVSEHVLKVGVTPKRRLRSYVRRALVAVTAVLDRIQGRSAPTQAAVSLSGRGARVLFMTGEHDAALHMLEAHFGPGAPRLTAMPGMSLAVVPGLDHTLGTHASRELAIPIIEAYLQKTLRDMTAESTDAVAA